MKPCYYLSVGLIIFASACNSATEQQGTAPITEQQPEVQEKTFKGLLSIRLNKKYFMDCNNSDKYYIIQDESGKVDSFYRGAQFQSYSGEAVYCELKGVLQKSSQKDQIHDGTLKVTSVIMANPKNFRNVCIPYDFWGLGTEPFWYIQISKKENIIDWKDGSKGITHRFEYVPPTKSDNVIKYNAAEKESGKTIQIQIEPRHCSDGMSEMPYEYEMTFIYDKENYSGCAIKWGSIPVVAN